MHINLEDDPQDLSSALQSLLQEQEITLAALKNELTELEAVFEFSSPTPELTPAAPGPGLEKTGRRRMLKRLGLTTAASGLALAAVPRPALANVQAQPKPNIGLLAKLNTTSITGGQNSLGHNHGLVACAANTNLDNLPDQSTGISAFGYRSIFARSETEVAIYGYSQTGYGIKGGTNGEGYTNFSAVRTQQPVDKESVRGSSDSGTGVVVESTSSAPLYMYPRSIPDSSVFTPQVGDIYLDIAENLWIWYSNPPTFTGWRQIKYVV